MFIFSTDMANMEQNVLKLKTEFNRAPEEIQNKYGGEEYIKSFQNMFGFGLAISQSRSKIHEVTNCLADAAIGKHPELRYTPGLKGKFLTWLTTVFPLEAIDLFFYHLINFYMRTVQKAVSKT
ncbi:hypothetical protein C0J52_20722 [Blattella germanica]|nr:hypothetical protein C0J52_20722 [Blattella germanica]